MQSQSRECKGRVFSLQSTDIHQELGTLKLERNLAPTSHRHTPRDIVADRKRVFYHQHWQQLPVLPTSTLPSLDSAAICAFTFAAPNFGQQLKDGCIFPRLFSFRRKFQIPAPVLSANLPSHLVTVPLCDPPILSNRHLQRRYRGINPIDIAITSRRRLRSLSTLAFPPRKKLNVPLDHPHISLPRRRQLRLIKREKFLQQHGQGRLVEPIPVLDDARWVLASERRQNGRLDMLQKIQHLPFTQMKITI